MILISNETSLNINFKKQTNTCHSIDYKRNKCKWSLEAMLWLKIISLLAFVIRFFAIDEPAEVVFDEVHFGKFISRYIKREYFLDVHPPLGKLVFLGVSKLFDYDGWFSFENGGLSYLDSTVPYIALRCVSALFGSLTVILTYAILIEMDYSLKPAVLAACMSLFDNALTTQSRLIVLDAQLIFYITMTCFCWIKFRTCNERPFSKNWFLWLFGTGVFIGFSVGVKFVGLFVMSLIGVCTLMDLWDVCDVRKTPSNLKLAYHWLARVFCLIFIPIAIFIISYWIHFSILNCSGTGDEHMSPQFQTTLKGNLITKTSMPVYYGSTITLKSQVESIYLHSRLLNYPHQHLDGKVSSQGQQVTGYTSENDPNNDWIILPGSSRTHIGDRTQVKHLDIVRLFHVKTGAFLFTHNVASPLTRTNQEVTAGRVSANEDENGKNFTSTLWKIDLKKGPTNNLRSRISFFRLIHVETECALINFQQNLPHWAFNQREINSAKNEGPLSWWSIEDVVYASPAISSNEILSNNSVVFENSKPGFWQKFSELLLVSFDYNSKLVDRNKETNSPLKWPLLIKGMLFWKSNDNRAKIYLLGNPVTWYICFFSIPCYLILLIFCIGSERRGKPFFNKAQRNILIIKGGFFLLGYLFHYVPFFFMGRILYFHHYLPCYLFNTFIFATLYQILVVWKPNLFGNKFLFGILFGVILGVFLYFSPITYGLRQESERSFYTLKWMKSWDFVN
jgi:dolichyl-phosphate-mannose-protein mannosyltransferase